MGKGCNKLFNHLFIENTNEKNRKGRSERLIAERNECLIDRFIYYGINTDKRFDVIINMLSKEFFLSPITVPNIIDENYELLALRKKEYQLIPESKLKKMLWEKWPHLMWNNISNKEVA
jgi:hypothetical protein